jgi:uncharacterized protein YihD (DUF1040 family)
MRDPKRIDRIMSKLTKKWKKYPDMRFLQFMINVGLVPDTDGLWFVEDDEIERHIKRTDL